MAKRTLQDVIRTLNRAGFERLVDRRDNQKHSYRSNSIESAPIFADEMDDLLKNAGLNCNILQFPFSSRYQVEFPESEIQMLESLGITYDNKYQGIEAQKIADTAEGFANSAVIKELAEDIIRGATLLGSKEFFDAVYQEMKKDGVANPKSELSIVADGLLKLTSDPISLDQFARNNFPKSTAFSTAAVDAMAKKHSIPEDVIVRYFAYKALPLEKHTKLNSKTGEYEFIPDPKLSDAENKLVEAINRIRIHAIKRGYLVTKGEDGPDNSPWANSIRESDKGKLQR